MYACTISDTATRQLAPEAASGCLSSANCWAMPRPLRHIAMRIWTPTPCEERPKPSARRSPRRWRKRVRHRDHRTQTDGINAMDDDVTPYVSESDDEAAEAQYAWLHREEFAGKEYRDFVPPGAIARNK